jgi:hypothetical protein
MKWTFWNKSEGCEWRCAVKKWNAKEVAQKLFLKLSGKDKKKIDRYF